jgi:hypothetical protein
MKAAFMTLFLSLVAVPCQAQVFLELGNSPVVSVLWEKPSFALGLGTGFGWSTFHMSDPFSGLEGKQDLIIFTPTVTGQFFLNHDPKARSFFETRVSKGVPIFSGARTNGLEQSSDDWTYGVGGGLRSSVADRLNIGGAADYSVTVRTADGQPDEISSGAGFRAFLQYRL